MMPRDEINELVLNVCALQEHYPHYPTAQDTATYAALNDVAETLRNLID